MDFIRFQPFLSTLLMVALLALVQAKGDDVLTPFIDDMCKEVECGRGSCEAAVGLPFNFKCNCEDGWKRTRSDDEQNLQFLPCIIPNCSLDYSCMPAAAPSPPIPYNISFFDPCYWIYCGEGTCTKNTTYIHTCQCNPGYSNLNNISTFPCYNNCAVGSQSCERLGVRVATSTSNSSSDDQNQGTTFSPRKFNWLPIFLVSMAAIF